MGRGGGAARVGCGALSLLGLLAGVGLTAWLSGEVLDDGGSGDRRPPTTLVAPEDVEPGVAVTVDPGEGLEDGQQVHVSSRGFAPGAAVAVRQCLTPSAGTSLVLGGATCDEGTPPVAVVVDARGRLEADVVVRAVVTAGGLPWDCAGEAGACSVVAATAGGERGGAELSFRAGVRPEITLPTG